MGRAEDLFLRLATGGLDAVAELLATRQSETLFLDFKRSADNGAGSKLNAKDRDNLSKAVSGFGNSEGGVIVWGVECKDSDGAGDYARDKIPIQNPARFKAWLEGAVSGASLPHHTTVIHDLVMIDETTGLVITLIPKSRLAPLQSTHKPQYYIRAGSDFVPATHGQLRGMFGHPDPPTLSHYWNPRGATLTPVMIPTRATILMDLCLTNLGPGLARDVFANVQFDVADPSEPTHFQAITPNWFATRIGAHDYSAVAPDGFKLAPEASVAVFNVHLRVAPPPGRPLSCRLSYGCDRSPVTVVSYSLDPDALGMLLARIRQDSPDRVNDSAFDTLFHELWNSAAV